MFSISDFKTLIPFLETLVDEILPTTINLIYQDK